jgi:hypothetical protein
MGVAYVRQKIFTSHLLFMVIMMILSFLFYLLFYFFILFSPLLSSLLARSPSPYVTQPASAHNASNRYIV